jgi:D-Ala-D-Ala ligase-like protein
MYLCVLSSPTDDPNVIGYDPSPYMNGFRWTHIVPNEKDIEGDIQRMIDSGVDVFLNMCSGGLDDPLRDLPNVLRDMGVAFTGAYGPFYDPPRAEMKNAALESGVPFPGTVFANTREEVDLAAETLRFPLLVKPPHGWASVGIRKQSRVETREALHEQAKITFEEFDGVLIEEFIDGRELTCLCVENVDDPSRPHTFGAMEYLFPPGECFKHVDMKWTYSYSLTPRPVTEESVDARLRENTGRLFRTMNGNGYARVDYRMNADGEIFMLEVNPNCGVFDEIDDPACADHILMNDPIGHKGFLELIVSNAIAHRDRLNGNHGHERVRAKAAIAGNNRAH